MEKTAKEMFEKLGFHITENTHNYIIYKNDERYEKEMVIFFILTNKTYEVCKLSKYFEDSATCVSVPLHLAITQQMKELGWIE